MFLINPYILQASGNTLWNDLLAYYTSDNTPNDALGTYNGTLTNGATYGTGIINQGFSFDGVNDYVNLGDNFDIGLDSWSYNIWIKPTSVGSFQQVLCKTDSGTYHERWWISVNTSSKLEFWLQKGVVNPSDVKRFQSTNTISSGVFTMITVVVDRTDKVYLYINGVAETVISTDSTVTPKTNELTSWSGVNFNTSFNCCIGASTLATNPFGGIVDEVAIWKNKILTASEVTQLYNSGSGLQY